MTNDDLRFLIFSLNHTINEHLQQLLQLHSDSSTYKREREFAEKLKEKLENRLAKDH